MNTSLQDQLDRIKALLHLTTADVSSVLEVLSEYHAILKKDYPQIPSPTERFLFHRKKLFQTSIEQMEDADPSLAARIQDLIDTHCKNYPLSYEEEE